MSQVQYTTIPMGIALIVFAVIGLWYVYTVQLPHDKADVLDAIKFNVDNSNWSCSELQSKIDYTNKQWLDQDSKNELNQPAKDKMESMKCP